MMREHAEIVERIRSIDREGGRDFFGAEKGELLMQLEFADAKEFLVADADPKDWAPVTLAEGRESAIAYVPFAIGKIDAHRGLSAGRSVDHMRSWIWLHGTDEQVAAFEAAEYTNYGAPKVKAFCEAMGCMAVWEDEATAAVRRMADGLVCREDGCYEGCGA